LPKSLGINDPDETADGPGDPDIFRALALTGEPDECSFVEATRRILPELYRKKGAKLQQALEQEATRPQVVETIHSLVDRIEVLPGRARGRSEVTGFRPAKNDHRLYERRRYVLDGCGGILPLRPAFLTKEAAAGNDMGEKRTATIVRVCAMLG
jgi:hypothetical protein